MRAGTQKCACFRREGDREPRTYDSKTSFIAGLSSRWIRWRARPWRDWLKERERSFPISAPFLLLSSCVLCRLRQSPHSWNGCCAPPPRRRMNRFKASGCFVDVFLRGHSARSRSLRGKTMVFLPLSAPLKQFRNWCRPKAHAEVAFSSRKCHLSMLSRSLRSFRNCSKVVA